MKPTSTINPRIVEGLYAEGLALADEVRLRFEALRHEIDGPGIEDIARVQLSCEALRTTTRVMHCLAWLLNYRAWFAGEISDLQLRRHGRLVANFPANDRAALECLPADVRLLVHDSERLYERIVRLERALRRPEEQSESAIARLRSRLAAAM